MFPVLGKTQRCIYITVGDHQARGRGYVGPIKWICRSCGQYSDNGNQGVPLEASIPLNVPLVSPKSLIAAKKRGVSSVLDHSLAVLVIALAFAHSPSTPPA